MKHIQTRPVTVRKFGGSLKGIVGMFIGINGACTETSAIVEVELVFGQSNDPRVLADRIALEIERDGQRAEVLSAPDTERLEFDQSLLELASPVRVEFLRGSERIAWGRTPWILAGALPETTRVLVTPEDTLVQPALEVPILPAEPLALALAPGRGAILLGRDGSTSTFDARTLTWGQAHALQIDPQNTAAILPRELQLFSGPGDFIYAVWMGENSDAPMFESTRPRIWGFTPSHLQWGELTIQGVAQMGDRRGAQLLQSDDRSTLFVMGSRNGTEIFQIQLRPDDQGVLPAGRLDGINLDAPRPDATSFWLSPDVTSPELSFACLLGGSTDPVPSLLWCAPSAAGDLQIFTEPGPDTSATWYKPHCTHAGPQGPLQHSRVICVGGTRSSAENESAMWIELGSGTSRTQTEESVPNHHVGAEIRVSSSLAPNPQTAVVTEVPQGSALVGAEPIWLPSQNAVYAVGNGHRVAFSRLRDSLEPTHMMSERFGRGLAVELSLGLPLDEGASSSGGINKSGTQSMLVIESSAGDGTQSARWLWFNPALPPSGASLGEVP